MNVFLYDKAAVDRSVFAVLRQLRFVLEPLTDDPSDFWGALNYLEYGDKLILVSHGDSNGPLMVRGESGDDMTGDDQRSLALSLSNKQVRFYCLSCHTGQSNLCHVLTQHNVEFVAPLGYANLNASFAGLIVKSVDGRGKPAGWVGSPSLAPSRSSSSITIYGR